MHIQGSQYIEKPSKRQKELYSKNTRFISLCFAESEKCKHIKLVAKVDALLTLSFRQNQTNPTPYLVAQEAGKTGEGAVAAAAEVEDEVDDDALRRGFERVEERVDLDGARL